jgi:hypothetical protein
MSKSGHKAKAVKTVDMTSQGVRDLNSMGPRKTRESLLETLAPFANAGLAPSDGD